MARATKIEPTQLNVVVPGKLLASKVLVIYSAEPDYGRMHYDYCHDNELERLDPRTI
jgi:hypothetical protein